MKIILGIVMLALASSCSDVQDEIKDLRSNDSVIEPESSSNDIAKQHKTEPSENQVKNEVPEWSYKIVFIAERNWGYQLFQKGTMVINQTSIPSIQGIDGFDSQDKAERTAKHILNKLENGIFPPTVNEEELDSLGVLRD